jgi:hypothetical protein
MRTFDLAGASSFLKMSREEVRRRVKAGLLPGAKAGKCWVFIEDDLADFLRSLYASPRQALRVVSGKEFETCHSINAVLRGGSGSPHQPGSLLDALLAQPTKP